MQKKKKKNARLSVTICVSNEVANMYIKVNVSVSKATATFSCLSDTLAMSNLTRSSHSTKQGASVYSVV